MPPALERNVTKIKISLPASMGKFIDEQVAREGFRSADDYVCALVRAARRKATDTSRNGRHAASRQPTVTPARRGPRSKRWRTLEELRDAIQLGVDQIERGQYTTYDRHTLPQLLRDVQAAAQRQRARRRR